MERPRELPPYDFVQHAVEPSGKGHSGSIHLPGGNVKMGAGVIPFCIKNGEVLFLFHKTFSGRRAGHLVDFGGGAEDGESHCQTAAREFIEETETMYFLENPADAQPTATRIARQARLVEGLLERTLHEHPDWWCRRSPDKKGRRKDWKTFFVEIRFRDPAAMNREWRNDRGKRFKKRRKLVWVSAAEILEMYRRQPHRLWRRVRELEEAEQKIRAIVRFSSPTNGR